MKIYHSLFLSHLTYGITCWGGTFKSKLQRIFNLQKRCVRILFGEIYSFDHPEYYSTCARAKTFTEHMAQKDYALEHTKPIFNKYNLLNLHNRVLHAFWLKGGGGGAMPPPWLRQGVHFEVKEGHPDFLQIT